MRRFVCVHGLAAAAFSMQIAALDVVIRGPSKLVAAPRHLFALAASTAFAWILSTLAVRRSARAVIAVVVGALLVLDCLYFHYYRDVLDAQALACARHAWTDVRRVVAEML